MAEKALPIQLCIKSGQCGLKYLNLDSLEERRDKFSLKFAKQCLRNPKVNKFFPLDMKNTKNTRTANKYKINFVDTERYKNSTIPSFQRSLNKHEKDRTDMIRIKKLYKYAV